MSRWSWMAGQAAPGVALLLPALAGCDVMFQLKELDPPASEPPAVMETGVTSCSSCATVALEFPVVSVASSALLLVNVVSSSGGGAPAVVSVTYGNRALRFHTRAIAPSAADQAAVEAWYLVDPPVGPETITVTAGAAAEGLLLGVSLIAGVSATRPIRGSASAGSQEPSLQADNTIPSGDLDLVLDAVCAGTSIDLPGPGQTVSYVKNMSNAYHCANLGSSWSTGAAAGVPLHWAVNGNTADHWIDLAVSIAPAD